MEQFGPLINPALLPDEDKTSSQTSRRKFSQIDDNFLLCGLKQFGAK